MEIKSIQGILNYVGKSKNFFEEYEVISFTEILCNQLDPESFEFFLICHFKNIPEKTLKMEISARSYLNMKYYLDKHTKYIPTSHKIFTSLCTFANIKIVACVVLSYVEEHYVSYIIFEKDGEYMCTDCLFTDAICIMQNEDFPVYINQSIIYELNKT